MNIGVILAHKGFTDNFRTSICSHPNRLKSILKIWPDSQFKKNHSWRGDGTKRTETRSKKPDREINLKKVVEKN